ncbi:DUF1206 domain-containing protein [Streptomyces sp. B8F3]|uniref:DUF1206 domain-containing protein n=1 Tax=unclassified Streptomyces TaxID=2593676 RepID=UPI00325C6B04
MQAASPTARTRRTMRRAAGSQAVEWGARAGLIGRGVLYLLIGVLAVRVAFGEGKREADRSGAVGEIAAQPLGGLLLYTLGAALVGMAVWRLSEAVFGAAGPGGHKASKRALSGARSVFYGFVAYSVLAFAAGEKDNTSSDRQSRDITARALEQPGGEWMAGVAGVGIAVAGAVLAARAALRSYRKHLRTSQMSRTTGRLVDVAGVTGGMARGLVVGAIGVFITRAALQFDPKEAKGIDAALKSFADTTAGPSLLVVVAAGLVLFALFSFACARWRRV